MKDKIQWIVFSMVFSVVMLASGLANASFWDCNPKLYLGLEVDGAKYDSTKVLTIRTGGSERTIRLPDNDSFFGGGGAGLTGFIGLRLNPCFGMELGYTSMTTRKITYTDPFVTISYTAKANNAYLDALGYLAVTDCLDAIGSLGVGLLSTSISGSATGTPTGIFNGFLFDSASQSRTRAGIRIGLGLAYKFGDNFGVRFMLRHQQGNQHIKSINSAALALFYQF
jgi:hypothetical protein